MNKRRLISRLAVVLWLVIIFILSVQPVHKSNEFSKGIAERIVKTIEKVSPEKDIEMCGICRKMLEDKGVFVERYNVDKIVLKGIEC